MAKFRDKKNSLRVIELYVPEVEDISHLENGHGVNYLLQPYVDNKLLFTHEGSIYYKPNARCNTICKLPTGYYIGVGIDGNLESYSWQDVETNYDWVDSYVCPYDNVLSVLS